MRVLFVLLCLMGWAPLAASQSIESIIMPGELIAGHAKLEANCENCHVRFKKKEQDRLCRDCHKPIRADIAAKRGYHGRLKPQPCRNCHTDHEGRNARIVHLDTKTFDHHLTDYALAGKHTTVKCTSCHLPGKKHRDAPGQCVDCHRKDDTHKGGLGPKCADCHDARDWKRTRFDHDTTDFKLRGGHTQPACTDCHANNRFKDTPTQCVACHRDDDPHKGRYGEKCASCHQDSDWKRLSFDHDRDTRYDLIGRHAQVKCDSCHTGSLYRDKLATRCVSCHRSDDPHKGALGEQCENCHAEWSWKRTRFDHAKTDFPLLGKHLNTQCESCHKTARYKDAPTRCVACHADDDKHKKRFGDKCDSCHGADDWKTIRFDHDRDTQYPLRARHRQVTCESCHTGFLYEVKLEQTCVSCHKTDDVHKGQLGARCDQCHAEDDWKRTGFDHGRSRFPLLGRHQVARCADCHKAATYRDAPTACVSCHREDDVHKQTLGPKCESCHNARDWRLWDFDHDKTDFRLDGAHRKVRCSGCHRQPVDKAITLATSCVSCHAGDDVHEGAFGKRCERCHVSERFTDVSALHQR
ncbi:cytochrome C [Nitrogeniibacter mangrovi]|uniref:Cytochrome C n=1 Tax=Nitrogeniibacter mangrovi TaxID=2016596 RepID=A0A6C1B549_9RHOO|nr:cytochrome C [Nitrogeniibacter mangrovi]QID17410.1 cytochrome C [Nitrogeniibacter mangrovi]